MTSEYSIISSATPTSTFIVPAPFEKALKQIRDVLAKGELTIPMEMDISGRIQRELGMRTGSPCRLLCVDSASSLLHSMVLHESARVLLPLHVVVTGQGPQTIASMLSRIGIGSSLLPAEAKAPITQLQGRIVQRLAQISLRQVA